MTTKESKMVREYFFVSDLHIGEDGRLEILSGTSLAAMDGERKPAGVESRYAWVVRSET